MHILTKKHVDVETSNKTAVAGQFRLVVRGPDGEVRRDTGWFDNLILDSGLNRWATGTIIGGVAIGTGTSTPVATQTGLDAQSAYTTSNQGITYGNSGAAPYYGTMLLVYRFAVGALNGNYTEIGIGWASGANMFSRALIVDSLGVPTTLTVGPTEQLDVSYTLRAYAPATDVVNTVLIGGVSTTVTTRASSVGAAGWGTSFSAKNSTEGGRSLTGVYDGAIGAITASPSGTPTYTTTVSFAAYVNNSFSITRTAGFSLSEGNLTGGIDAMWVSIGIGLIVNPGSNNPYSAYQYAFSPAIAKDNTKTMNLVTSHSWVRRP